MVKNFQFMLKKLNECPLCHKLALIINSIKDEECVNLYCGNCNLEFTFFFSFRNFINLKEFKEL